jgi:hypothetical protein
VNVPVAGLRLESVAVHSTVVMPTGKRDPEGGVHVTGSGPSMASLAVASKVTTVPSGPSASTVMSSGRLSTGEAPS